MLPVRKILRLAKIKAAEIVILLQGFDLQAGAKPVEPAGHGELPASAFIAA